jgi:hypothetical protein
MNVYKGSRCISHKIFYSWVIIRNPIQKRMDSRRLRVRVILKPVCSHPKHFWLFSILFVLISLQSYAQDRGLEVVAKSFAGDDWKIGKQYAVLIGIDEYQEWNPLRNPVTPVPEYTSLSRPRSQTDMSHSVTSLISLSACHGVDRPIYVRPCCVVSFFLLA